jgi:hypothetical protein
MATTEKQTERAPRCAASVEGPRVGRRVVAWRRECANHTRHPSGYCHAHKHLRESR